MGEQSQEGETGPNKELSETERAELERLRKENATLRMERDFAKKVAAWFAKRQPLNTRRTRTGPRKEYTITFMCAQLGVCRQGFYRWWAQEPCARERTDAELTGMIRQIHTELRGDPGVRRVHAELVVRGPAGVPENGSGG
jgi:transposase-like protein